MSAELIMSHPYWTLLFFAFFSNVPLGFIRQGHPKFSGKWFFWIHASIPFLIYLRLSLHVHAWIIPLTISAAVIGQIMGSRIRQKNMDEEEKESIAQITELNIQTRQRVTDNDVLVALLNMGGPKTNADVKDFQKRLFNDPLLIKFPLSFILQKFFAKILITFRLKAVEERYQLIGGGSPIYRSTELQVHELQKELKRRGRDIEVGYSFNYSPPLSEDTVKEAKSRNKKYLIPLSLYPHFSKATTGSNIHYLKIEAKKHYPELKFLHAPSYHLHPGYIEAFVDRVKETMKDGERLDDFYLLFSAHGLPLYFLAEGDPYPFLISQSVAQILARLGRRDNWSLSYQSAVGPLQWLKPSTDDMIAALSRRGIRKLLIVPVSFVGDHIETICEIDIEYRAMAEKLGISDLRMSRAIENHPEFIRALADTVEAALGEPKPGIEKQAQFAINQ